MLIDKLKPIFEKWINGEALPTYMTTTRVVFLSKEEGNPTPAEGKVRTIAISNAVFKLYEKVVFQKLNEEIRRCQLICDK